MKLTQFYRDSFNVWLHEAGVCTENLENLTLKHLYLGNGRVQLCYLPVQSRSNVPLQNYRFANPVFIFFLDLILKTFLKLKKAKFEKMWCFTVEMIFHTVLQLCLLLHIAILFLPIKGFIVVIILVAGLVGSRLGKVFYEIFWNFSVKYIFWEHYLEESHSFWEQAAAAVFVFYFGKKLLCVRKPTHYCSFLNVGYIIKND